MVSSFSVKKRRITLDRPRQNLCLLQSHGDCGLCTAAPPQIPVIPELVECNDSYPDKHPSYFLKKNRSCYILDCSTDPEGYSEIKVQIPILI